MPTVEVSVPAAGIPNSLTYELPESFSADNLIGKRVRVTLKNRPVAGLVLSVGSASKFKKLKSIEAILDENPIVTPNQIELCRFVSEYYFAPLGEVLRLCFPPDTQRTLKKDKLTKRRRKTADIKQGVRTCQIALNAEQQAALEAITSEVPSPASKRGFLLEGITGSGKTEVYIQAAKQALENKQSVLVIVPEIALTPQLEQRFMSQLDAALITWHSGLKQTDRREAIYELLKGEPRIVLGARSALFTPLPNLGLIIVDEEHDSSFKQDETPRYNGRDLALWRAQNEGAKIVLGSATPSLESRVNIERGKLKHLSLTKRASLDSRLPVIEIIDIKSRAQHQNTKRADRSQSEGQTLCILSAPLKAAMKIALGQGEQVLLFLNRRGYSSIALCDSCGEIVECPHCSISLVSHEHGKKLCCHQCGYICSFIIDCPKCKSGPILNLGLGTERVEKEANLEFPDYKTVRIDRDTADTAKKLNAKLKEIQNGEAQIIIGTQMTAKGHDFPKLTLVGVILADIGLSMPDFRASERSFQLLTQVAGRAGRRETQGRVLIQTFNPKNPVFEAVKTHDIRGFSELDKEQRLLCKQPPFSRAALLRIESKSLEKSKEISQMIKSKIQNIITSENLSQKASLLGPSPAPIEKLRDKYRWQLYLRCSDNQTRQHLLKSVANEKYQQVRLVIDIDPIQML